MPSYQARRLLWTMLSSDSLHKVPLGIHQIEVDTMIDQIILALLHALRRAEIHPIRFTDALYLLPSPCKPNEIWMELLEVFFEHSWGISGGVASDENRYHFRHVLW